MPASLLWPIVALENTNSAGFLRGCKCSRFFDVMGAWTQGGITLEQSHETPGFFMFV